MPAPQMFARDAVAGSSGSCYLTINNRRINFMSLTEFDSKLDVNLIEVPILGKVGMGHKAAGFSGTWSGTAHYNQSYFREMALEYQKTGIVPYFNIQVTNEDLTAQVGRQTITLYDCLCDSFPLAKLLAGQELLDEDLSGTFDSWDMPEKFTELAGTNN